MQSLKASILSICLLLALSVSARAYVPTRINVQGRLTDREGTPIGNVEQRFDFKIFNAQVGGIEVWPKIDETGERHVLVPDKGGLWTTEIGSQYPISPEVFSPRNEIDDTTRWLQITVEGQPLPRVRLISGSYAMKVGSLDGATGGNIFGNINLHSQFKVGDEAGDAGRIKVTDGSQTTITAEGTTGDLTALGKATIGPGHVNSGSFTFVAGLDNSVSASAYGSSIGGGKQNEVTGDYSTVSGGISNTANGEEATIGGGGGNDAVGYRTTVAGGTFNTASGDYSTIAGGYSNESDGVLSTVGGGGYNNARGQYSTVAGGGGGVSADSNSAVGDYSSIGGGSSNDALGLYSTVSGGIGNRVAGVASDAGVIGGGDSNKVDAKWGTIAGGKDNLVSSTATAGFVGGGRGNTASGSWTVVVGGTDNSTSFTHGTVGGGSSNRAWGTYSTVPGGRGNEASGNYTFAAGRRAKALHAGSFVWADDTDADFASTGTGQFLIRVADGVGINTNDPMAKLSITASSTNDPGIYISGSARDLTWPSGQSFQFGTLSGETFNELVRVESGGDVGIGTVSPNYKLDVRGTIGNNATLYHSDRRWKTDVRPLESSLERVIRLQGVSYEWKRDDYTDMNFPDGRHIGVIAQDVENIIPEVVLTAEDGYKSVDYAKLVAVLIEAVKELKADNDELRALIEGQTVQR